MSYKVYIGNLAFDNDPQDLENDFAKFGKISQCAVKRGFAFIHFENEDDAAVAVKEMDGQEWHGRRLRVAFSTSSGEGGDRGGRERGSGGRDSQRDSQITRNLFIANIPPEVKLSELEEFFEQYGKVENVKILPQARGNAAMSAFVDFQEDEAAQKAHDGELEIRGQRLRTDYNFRRESRRNDDNDRRQGGRERYGRRDNYDDRRDSRSRDGGSRRSRSRSRSRDNRNGQSDRYYRDRRSPPRGYDRDGDRSRRDYRDSPRGPPRDDRARGSSPRNDRNRSPPRH